MMLFARMPVIGAMIAGAICAAGVAAGVVVMSPVRAADDFPVADEIGPSPPLDYRDAPDIRYDDRPAIDRPYRPGRFAPGPYAAIPSGRFDRFAPETRPLLPPVQVMGILRSGGFAPLGRITQRGWIYTVAVLDRHGDDGRLVIDGRTGRIMRFIPAMEVDGRFEDRMAMIYSPPGPPPVVSSAYEPRRGSLLDMNRSPRPPLAVPKAATARKSDRLKAASPKIASRMPQPPSDDRSGNSPSPQQTSPQAQVAESNAAAVTVGTARPAASSAVELQPTKPMPPVQPLE